MGFAGRERIVFSAISSCMKEIDSIRCPTVDRGRKPLKMSGRESLVQNSNMLVEVNRERSYLAVEKNLDSEMD